MKAAFPSRGATVPPGKERFLTSTTGDHAATLEDLVRPPQEGRLTTLGCPDCSGVLAVSELGGHGYLRFACQVGHVFSAQALLESKEVELEDSLWSAVETSQELAQLCKVLSARAESEQLTEQASTLKKRSKAAAHCLLQVRALIETPGGQPRDSK